MTNAATETLIARNPSTGEVLGEVARTSPEDLGAIVARASAAQRRWGETPWRGRRAFLERWRRVLSAEADTWAAAIEAEVGKPRDEAMGGDVLATLDALRWTARRGGKLLAGRRIARGWQAWLAIPPARLRPRPVGVVGMIGTWNYPLLMNAPTIAQALAAGNAVVWKPSELAPLAGLRLHRGLEQAGVPSGLVTTVFGGPEVGAALVGAEIDKGVFTGGIENGRSVLTALARRGITAVAELSGFDPAIILPDAPRDATVRALTWGAFVNSGQACVAVKRVYVVGDASPWAEALAQSARRLRVGNPAEGPVDLGPLISESARSRFHRTIEATLDAGAQLLCGGAPAPGRGWFYPPTVLRADTPAPEVALAGVFGPVVLVRGFACADAAVEAANDSPYALAASVWGRDLRSVRAVADRLDAGMVALNDAVTPAAQASAPFGGNKASGFGRTRGAEGLREFTRPQTLHVRRPGGFRPHLFPYRGRLAPLLAIYRRIFHPCG